ncbi:MAG: glutamate--tRNA ligase [Candidatus Micrarchaeaceae archaeon]
MDEEVIKLARKYAIKNAVDYGGKASIASVLSKVLSIVDKHGDINSIRSDVERVVGEVNALSKEDQTAEYQSYRDEFELEHKKKVESTASPNMKLEGAEEGNFSTRFAPEPSGYLHIGHAKVVFMEQELAKVYHGKVFLYFDDTNPEKEEQEFVDAIKRDLDWLGVKFDDEYYASDSIEKLYGYARQLIEKGKAYVCTCPPETIKSYRMQGTECPHTRNPTSENMMMFEEMINGEYEEGGAILRFRGDMKDKNTVMRDPTLMRIKKHAHYRQGNKYMVWPTYDFNTPIMDSLHGVTDAMRSKEYELRADIYKEVLKALGLRVPRMHHIARLEIKGSISSKRKLNALIKDGLISGYDDPRLTTIAALRRRGIRPEAIRKFVLRFGMSITNSVVDLSLLYAENKRIVDPVAKRLFYVENPVKVIVENPKPGFQAVIRLHPNQELGSRSYNVGSTFFISGSDAQEIDIGSAIRLKDLADIKINSVSHELIHARFENPPSSAKDIKKVQWVSDGNYLESEVLMPGEMVDENGNFLPDSLKTSKGFVESYAKELKRGEIVQFERFGFVVFDGDENSAKRFIYISK